MTQATVGAGIDTSIDTTAEVTTNPSKANKPGRARRFWQWLKRVVNRLRDWFPLTLLGVLVLGPSATALVLLGVRRVDLILLVIGAVVLASGLISLLFVVITALVIKLAHRKAEGEPSEAEVGVPTRTGYSFTSLWWVPIVNITWTWLSPAASIQVKRERGRLHEMATPMKRGIYENIERRVEISDAFGFCKVAIRLVEKRSFRVFPHVGKLKQVSIARSIATGDDLPSPAGAPDGDRADIRRYSAGDPVRFLLWKVYARTRQAMVRTPEQAISPSRKTLAYLVAADEDEAAAGAARLATESNALGVEWVFGADGGDRDATKVTEALDTITRSGTVLAEQGGAGLRHFLNRNVGRTTARVVLFVPATPGPWVDNVCRAVKASALGGRGVGTAQVEFVVAADGIERAQKKSWMSKLMTSDQPSTNEANQAEKPGVQSSQVNKVMQALAATRGRVLVVDRRTGRIFADGATRTVDAS